MADKRTLSDSSRVCVNMLFKRQESAQICTVDMITDTANYLTRIIHDEDGAGALTPWPPLSRKRRGKEGEKNKNDLHHFRRSMTMSQKIRHNTVWYYIIERMRAARGVTGGAQIRSGDACQISSSG